VSFAASDFCQRWAGRKHSWRHRSEGGFDASGYDVAPLAESDARTFVEVNHYAVSYPAARLRFGLYDGPWLVGVAVLGGADAAARADSGLPGPGSVRGVARAEPLRARRVSAGERRELVPGPLLQLAARLGVRGVVSFSDPVPRRTAAGELVFPGHIGTIYQASNAEYLGRTTPRRVVLLPDGRASASARCPRSAVRSRATPTSSASSRASARGRGGSASRERRGCATRCRQSRADDRAQRQPSVRVPVGCAASARSGGVAGGGVPEGGGGVTGRDPFGGSMS